MITESSCTYRSRRGSFAVYSKTTPPTFVTTATYAAGVRRFGADKVARFAALVGKFGEPDLRQLSHRYQQPLL